VEKALAVLLKDGNFCVDKIDYDQRNFGNVYVLVRSNNQVNIRFVKDRDTFWCEIGKSGEWYFIEDVFALIGADYDIGGNDLYEFMSKVAIAVKDNTNKIFNMFASSSSQIKIKELATKRAINMFI